MQSTLGEFQETTSQEAFALLAGRHVDLDSAAPHAVPTTSPLLIAQAICNIPLPGSFFSASNPARKKFPSLACVCITADRPSFLS